MEPQGHRSRQILAILLFVMGDSVASESAGRAEYVETTGTNRLSLTSWEIPQSSGTLLHSQSSQGEIHDLFVDGQLRTVWWTFRDPDRKIDIRAERRENRIEITGGVNGKPVRRRLRIDGAPWYQSMERSLVPFALGRNGAREEFWVVHPYSFNARKIQAQHEGRQTIMLNGLRTETAVVKISLPGFLAAFWNSRYWYRIPDGKFVQFEGPHGPPGSPLTTVRLIREFP